MIASLFAVTVFSYIHFDQKIAIFPAMNSYATAQIDTDRTPKSLLIDFNDGSQLNSFKVKQGKLSVDKNGGIDNSDGVLVDPYTVLSFDISKYKLPIKMTYYYDMFLPKPSTSIGPSFGLYELKDTKDLIYLIYGFHKVTSFKYFSNKRTSQVKKSWFKKEIYLFENRVETWVDGKRKHVIYCKSSGTFIMGHSGKTFIDNFSLEEINEKDLKLNQVEVNALNDYYIKEKAKKVGFGVFDVKNETIEKIFKSDSQMKLNIFNFDVFNKAFKEHQVGRR
ncbi:MAG: hypothetical protein COA79_07175 [Planctomycetota bacterium]|nr:MAG: hypothetical protein COA79_07175 [Planctomycetota bacterium]